MIKTVIDLLTCNDWHGTKSEVIEIAKGKYELPKNFKGTIAKLRRLWQ